MKERFSQIRFPIKIWTIGHSTRSVTEFIDTLNKYDIEILADVRSIPYSRRNPQFNKESLERSLINEGIKYIHIPELGGMREVKDSTKNPKLRNKILRGFAEIIDSKEYSDGLKILCSEANDANTAYMCAELDWHKCHRAVISDHLCSRGTEVIHIIDKNTSEHHEYTKGLTLFSKE